jgi:hypothetical protein
LRPVRRFRTDAASAHSPNKKGRPIGRPSLLSATPACRKFLQAYQRAADEFALAA